MRSACAPAALPSGEVDHTPRDRGGEVRPAFGDGSSRRGYGVPVFEQCGYACAYCGFVVGSLYEAWLQLSVDHVMPGYLVRSDRRWLRSARRLHRNRARRRPEYSGQ